MLVEFITLIVLVLENLDLHVLAQAQRAVVISNAWSGIMHSA